MNESTDGVTLYAGFVLDIVGLYDGLGSVADPVREMALGLDPRRPRDVIPIALYNRACEWVESTFGEAGARDAGKRIGERSYKAILERTGKAALKPNEVLRELQRSARISIQDTSGRGWEILADGPRRVVLRRTQTFHCLVQEGLLLSLVDRSGAERAKVAQINCTRNGDEFCDYAVSWSGENR